MQRTSSSLALVTLALITAAACGDTSPGDLPECALDAGDIAFSLDSEGKLVASWSDDLDAVYLGVSDLGVDEGESSAVYSAGAYCNSYWFTPTDATCISETPITPIGGSPLRTAALDGADVPTTGDPTLVAGRPYSIALIVQDGAQPTCRSEVYRDDVTF
jgi:hypothetical protein